MAAIDWPLELPQRIFVGARYWKREDRIIFTTEFGPPKVRRGDPTGIKGVRSRMVLDQSQAETLLDFWEVVTKAGAEAFNFEDPIRRVDVDAIFDPNAKNPIDGMRYLHGSFGNAKWETQVSIMFLPAP